MGSVWDWFGIGREIEHSRKPLLTTPNEHSKNKSGTISQKKEQFSQKIFAKPCGLFRALNWLCEFMEVT